MTETSIGGRRARGFAAWNPHGRTLERVQFVLDVLGAYRPCWPLTARQLQYALARRGATDLSPKAYDALQELLARARRSGVIPFEAVYDQGVAYPTAPLDLAGQDALATFAELITTRPALVPQLASTLHPLGIPVFGFEGFASVGTGWQIATRVAGRDRPTVLYLVTDFYGRLEDEATRALIADARAFSIGLGAPEGWLRSGKLALRRPQIDLHDLLPEQAVRARSQQPISDEKYAVEALAPAILAKIVTAIRKIQSDETARTHGVPTLVDASAQEFVAASEPERVQLPPQPPDVSEIDWSTLEIGSRR